MTYPPAQMNKTAAAEYCGVSIKIFTTKYQPRLTAREDGNIYFWTTEMDELIRILFTEEREKNARQTIRPKPRKPTTQQRANGSAFTRAMASGK
ncbi:hypothetical protein EOL70_13615 [Leucothrix sargassi]|nr:hypothetical protein EOL70_13615 [Leucothrix sargassi]